MSLEGGSEVIPSVIHNAINATGYIEVDDGQEVVAAAAIVASRVPDSGIALVSSVIDEIGDIQFEVSKTLIRSTIIALDRIAADNSELAELWRDTARAVDFAQWSSGIERLKSALLGRVH